MHRTTSRPVPRGQRLLRSLAGVCAGLLVGLATAVPAVAGLTGYGPVGPDPASQLGMSVPVLAAEVGGPAGSVVTAALSGATVTVTRPGGYSTGSQVLSITDLSGDGVAEALLPADMLTGSEVVLGLGVGVRPVEAADDGAGVQGRAVRGPGSSSASGATGAPMPVGASGRADALTVVVQSPALTGATVVVVGDRTDTSVSDGDTVTLELDGPAAVFALQPTAGPAEVATSPSASAEPEPTSAGTDAAAAASADTEPAGTSSTLLLLVLAVLLLVGLGVPLLMMRSRGGRRRADRP